MNNPNPCKHTKHHIAEREFYQQKKSYSGTRIICKKCGANIFIKDKEYGIYNQLNTNTMEQTYLEKELVSFGNYLLSKQRNYNVSEQCKDAVTDADLANWKTIIEQEKSN